MNILAIGDVHIKVNNLPEAEELILRLTKLAEERKPDLIICLGDVLDRHSTIHVQCLMLAEKMTEALSKIAPFFLIVGNHDRPNNSDFLTDRHPFNAMKKWDNVYIIDSTFKYNYKDFNIVLVPYVPPGRFNEALNTVENIFENTSAIFAHQEIYGAKMGAIISQDGDKWSEENPVLISGHIHNYDQLQKNMIYTGSVIQHSFGDNGDKTVSMFTFTENNWEQERISLGMTKKVIIYITPEQVLNYKVPKDKIVKLVVRGEESAIKTVIKLDKIQELKKEGVKVVFKTIHNVEVAKETQPKMSYRDRLYNELGRDLNSLSWFKKIFEY